MAQTPALVFENTYSETSVSVALSGTKSITSNDPQLTRLPADGEFSFKLTEVDANGNEVTGGLTQTVQNTGSAFAFSELTYTEPGTHYYEVEEVRGADGTIGYSSQVYTATVVVSADEAGVLSAQVSYRLNGEVAEGLAFTNAYTPTPVSVWLDPGDKILEGRAQQAGEFTFLLLDVNGNEVQRTTNTAEGTFAFSNLNYSATGVYTYTVVEDVPTSGVLAGMAYNTTNAVYTVTVTVTENANHALEASVAYTSAGEAVSKMTFTNVYAATEDPDTPTDPDNPENPDDPSNPDDTDNPDTPGTNDGNGDSGTDGNGGSGSGSEEGSGASGAKTNDALMTAILGAIAAACVAGAASVTAWRRAHAPRGKHVKR